MRIKNLILIFIFVISTACKDSRDGLPSSYSLNNKKLSSSFKKQAWGCCWSFAVMSSLESNLIINNNWHLSGEKGEPDLSEYHMDKYNGFNRSGQKGDKQTGWYSGQGEKFQGSNTDDLSSGVVVHLGGDFRMAAAYLSNHGGAVQERLSSGELSNDSHRKFGDTKLDGVLYKNNYTYYQPSHVEWLTLSGSILEKRNKIKHAILRYGAVASAQNMNDNPLAYWKDGLEIHMNTNHEKLNHAVSLIGWNNDVIYKNHKGAWIVKDSDHVDEKSGKHIGQFYVMYDDLHMAKDKFMGGVLFRDVKFRGDQGHIYSHALHGWRYTTPPEVEEVYTSYKSTRNENLSSIGIYTVGNNIKYKTKISVNDVIKIELSGVEKNPGFHMIRLEKALSLKAGDRIKVYQSNSDFSFAYDASFKMEVLLNGKLPKWGDPVIVNSRASSGETFFRLKGETKFKDFKNYTKTPKGNIKVKHALENATSNIVLNMYTSSKK